MNLQRKEADMLYRVSVLAVTLLGNNISTIFNAIATNISGWNIGT